MEKINMNKKKFNLGEFINSPRLVIFILTILLVTMFICLLVLKKNNRFYYSEIQVGELTIADIQYYETPTLTYFYANSGIYTGENRNQEITYFKIGYYVKIKDELKPLEEYETTFDTKSTLGDAFEIYSKFKIADFKKSQKIFTKEVRDNIENLYLKVEASTQEDETIDISNTYSISLNKVN